ncbi:putative uncharacterized protein DDB_G0282129 [Scaptodrosophila lebanonensis]|uniref:Uncharacterized protein n=1 Tax=Drosophila lebanonensis TaxID=7225 RepID=A0A6J2UB93_DROLE|nr:putative uncharacterized protein DDB_G0282129 [Scaptodrosophila lebanonensis]
MSRMLLLLLLVGSSYAATHVNITIAQQPVTNPADVSYVEGRAPAELRAGPWREGEERLARLRQPDQMSESQQQQQQSQQQQLSSQQQQQSQQQLTPRQGLGLQPSNNNNNNVRMSRPNMRRVHMRRPSTQQQQQQLLPPNKGQFRQRSQQRQQNQEFERYIQSYHSHGPTVETVYETSNPAPQRYTQSSSSFSSSSSSSSPSSEDSKPQRLVSIGNRAKFTQTFERQVALPAAQNSQPISSSNVAQSANVEQDIKPIYEPQVPVQSATVSPSMSSANVGALPATAPLPSDTPSSFDAATTYNKPGYEPSSYNYDDGQDYQDQYPPSVDADSSNYDDYGDQPSYQGGSGYLPPPAQRGYSPPRPLVTKTIQIVQPALKAKKYEVRHPAIQKEFYDIEERVVIKPAGTLVVELDRPVAKIPKGETLLPLGHPHPAVASAYNTNTQIGSYNNNNNEYRPLYDAPSSKEQSQTSTTVGSAVTTMPAYDQVTKNEFVDSQLQQQQPGSYADETDSGRKSKEQSFLTASDGNGNQYQINTKNLTPNMLKRPEEAEYSNYERQPLPPRNYQRNYNRQPYNNEDYFSGEFLPNANAGNVDAKPARLQQAAVQEQPRPQIIKHEHNIRLPPSQHNIYLGRSRQVPKELRIGSTATSSEQEVPAQVAEVRPYLRNHVGGTVVYAKAAVRPAVANNMRGYFPPSSRYRNPLAEELEYSAPYARMRYVPEESGKLVELPADKKIEESEKRTTEESGKTHIQIQIPNRNEQDKPIIVASTISPAVDKPDCDKRESQEQQEQFQRLVEVSNSVPTTQATPTPVAQQSPKVDVSVKSAAGHMTPNERVIAATPAPTDAAATSETFHKRRIVVNHPFQTVREVVEHEPITNYHQIQVNEPATPALYHQAAYYQPPVQTHGNLVHYQSTSTHGNLYAAPVPHLHYG